MKKIYILYGKGPSGKTTFINDFVLKSSKSCLVKHDHRITSFDFTVKYNPIRRHYKNIIIEGWYCNDPYEEKVKMLVHDILTFKNYFENLFIICHTNGEAWGITERLKTENVIIKYLDFNDVN